MAIAATVNREEEPTSLLLYSTNPLLKYLIYQRFVPDGIFAWCSERFNPSTGAGAKPWQAAPPSSNPYELYRALRQASTQGDQHDAKIITQRASIEARAIEWHASGRISLDARNEIVYWAKSAPLAEWRPVLYVIPTRLILDRCSLVPPQERAGLGVEWRIRDLRIEEFDCIELP